jgi:hypothetical protein
MMINRVKTFMKLSSIVGLSLAMLASAKLASAQQAAFPLPNAIDTGEGVAPGGPACASSANGSGHMICVYGDSNNNLYAVSVLTRPGEFESAGTDTAPYPKGNPLPLGVVGTVGISSCASTADGSGDVVCGYKTVGAVGTTQLMGIRFNILNGNPGNLNGNIYTQNLGVVIDGTPVCTNGTERHFPPLLANTPKTELADGATICVVRSTGDNVLVGVAFNPASAYFKLESAQAVATRDPACANPNPGAFLNNTTVPERVICVYNSNGSMRSIAVNTNPFGFSPSEFNPYPTMTWDLFDWPGCSSPDDGSGDLICAVVANASGKLYGFAVNPVTMTKSPATAPVRLFTNMPVNQIAVAGAPSCAGLADGSNQVICSFGALECLTTRCIAGSTAEVPPWSAAGVTQWSYAIKFDARTNTVPSKILQGVEVFQGVIGDHNASCTFQNVNQDQISCGVPGPDGTLLGEIFK